MQYRNLRENETEARKKLQSIVYFMKYEIDEPSLSPKFDKIRTQNTRGAFTEDGKLTAVLEMFPFSSYLDGTIVGSSGVAGVATLLEHRRSGAVKNLLKNAYKEMYEKGDVMSYLYPFSHEYYRKYGYAQGSYGDLIKIDIKQFKDFNCSGTTRQYFPGDGYDNLKYVYDKFASQFNCCIAREDWDWERLFSNDPYTKKERVFIRYNSKDEPVAYLKMNAEEVSEYNYDMNVSEAAWHGNDGITGLMTIIGAFKGDLGKIKLIVPNGFPIEVLVKETWGTDVTRYHTGMNRIINVKTALEIMKKPDSASHVIIGVDDEHAPWNSGNWLVEWDSSGSVVVLTDRTPDLSCKISSLSQLITGHMPLYAMLNNSDVTLHSNNHALKELFIKKPCFIWDRF
ncbi:MAG: GNAT family N-acetyltransferase [Clostridiales bacterium]|nr:GNAT family N-acetyltransferase [Clostridiales bacterium]